MISVDTNILIRLFIHDNPAQSKAAEQLFESNKQIAIADTALIETIFIIAARYDKGRDWASNCVEALLDHAHVICSREIFYQTLRLYRQHPALSIEDCYLVSQAKFTHAVPLMTFDKKLANQTQHSTLLDT